MYRFSFSLLLKIAALEMNANFFLNKSSDKNKRGIFDKCLEIEGLCSIKEHKKGSKQMTFLQFLKRMLALMVFLSIYLCQRFKNRN